MRRDHFVRLAAAMWGLAIAISLLPLWEGPPPPGQLPGFATWAQFDARAPMRFIAGVMLIPLLWTLLLRPLLDVLASADSRAWARNAFAGGAVAILWFVIIDRNLAWVLIAPALVLATALALRRRDARFSRYDLILIPAFATVYLALLDLLPWSVERTVIVALGAVFAVRVALIRIRPATALTPALCFALAPLGLTVQSSLNGYDVRHSPWLPLVLALTAPFALRALLRDTPELRRRIRLALRWVIYPLAAYAYFTAAGLTGAEGMPRSDMFEDQQHVAPAGEMLRGEKPYRDIIPAHGFLQDALLDYTALRTGPVTLGRALKFRGVVSATAVIAHYALVTAATGSAEVGIATTFLASLLGTSGGSFRILPALFTLAILAGALRRRDPRWLAAAGVGVVICIVTSLDHGAYLLITLIVAVLRFRGDRKRAALSAAAGGVAASIVLFIALGIAGIAVDFVRVTLLEIATLGPVYTLSPFDAPASLEAIHHVPEVLGGLLEHDAFPYVFWPVTMLLLVVAVTSRPPRSPRRAAAREALLIVAVYAIITAISYAERHHVLWQFVAAPLISIAVFRLFHSRAAHARVLAGAMIVIAIMTAQPTTHLAIVGALRRAHGVLDRDWRERPFPRAKGALIRDADAATIDAVQRYADAHLQPGQTWFDFTNRGLLYFLLDRDCPIRQLEVAFYETEERQRDVIRRIEQNPRIRFALVPPEPDNTAVDNVSNRDRAPLVWAYLQQHFRPDHEEAGVLFWRRK